MKDKTIHMNWSEWQDYCFEHGIDSRKQSEDGYDLGGGNSLTITCDESPPATDWLCECGKRPGNDVHTKWRWDGENWQHYHGYPIGHVIAEYKPEEEKNDDIKNNS